MAKLYLTILLSLLCTIGIQAQKLNVESFVAKTNDITARTQPRQDINKNDCALVKVQLAASNAVFEGNVVGNVAYNTSEYLVYMAQGSKKLTVKLEGYLPLEVVFQDYGISSLESKTVYLLTISGVMSGKEQEPVKTKTGWIVIDSEPSGASVYINDEFVGNTPLFNYKQAYGTYQYRLESPNYHPATGIIELNAGRFEQKVVLKPAFGSISVKSSIAGAKIILDGKQTGRQTPATLTEIPSGPHSITLQMDKYAPKQQEVTVEDGQTAKVSMTLDARFARITINSLDGAEIYSNGKLLGKGRISEDLMEGYYDLEARLNHYKSVTKQIQAVAGQSQEITLNPIPKYGSLDIVSTPMNAIIRIDGKEYGRTPYTVERLLEGKHQIIVSLEGYSDAEETIEICDNETTAVTILINKKDENIIHLSSSGELKEKIRNSVNLERLKISGVMDARDFNYIKNNCKRIKYLDLSDVNILSYSGFDGTDKNTTYYAANEIPLGAFFYWVPIDDGMPSLNEVILPVGIKRIGRNAFARAYNLKRINIPEGVEEISFVSFAICHSLKSIELPSSIKKLGRLAFADCKNLSTVVIRASYPPSIEDNSFNGILDGATLIVPFGKGDLYRHSNWNRFFRIVEE